MKHNPYAAPARTPSHAEPRSIASRTLLGETLLGETLLGETLRGALFGAKMSMVPLMLLGTGVLIAWFVLNVPSQVDLGEVALNFLRLWIMGLIGLAPLGLVGALAGALIMCGAGVMRRAFK